MQQCMLGAMDEFCTMLVPSMHCSMIFIIFFVCLMVTIVEVHKLIIDVCVSLSATIDENFVDKLFGKSFILTDCHRITFTVINTTSI